MIIIMNACLMFYNFIMTIARQIHLHKRNVALRNGLTLSLIHGYYYSSNLLRDGTNEAFESKLNVIF